MPPFDVIGLQRGAVPPFDVIGLQRGAVPPFKGGRCPPLTVSEVFGQERV